LPDGITAVSPGNNTTYNTPEGKAYSVRNPNFTPFYSIRFKSGADSIANGQSATFSFTLPKQIRPTFFNLSTRLAPQLSYDTYLNTFNCPIGITPSVQSRDEHSEPSVVLDREATLLLYPNPTTGLLFVDLSPWNGQELNVRILNSVGQCVQTQAILADTQPQALQMSEKATPGLYVLELWTADGQRFVVNFVFKN